MNGFTRCGLFLAPVVLGLSCRSSVTEEHAIGHEAAALGAPCSSPEAEPVVEIVRGGPFNGLAADDYARANNDDLIGTISNPNFHRFWDGTCGSYKVPVRIVAPRAAACDSGRLAHVGVIELIHPGYIGFLPPGLGGLIQEMDDPVYDPLLDHGQQEAWGNLRAWFLFGDPSRGGGGVTYVGFQANNYFGSLDYIASLPENSGLGLHLERPQDYAIVYRDVSKWLREPKTPQNFVSEDRPDLCPVSEVVGFGYSYTAHQLKQVIANPRRLNSTWGAADPAFSRGLVLDGILLGGVYGEIKNGPWIQTCLDVTASGQVTMPCSGPDAPSEGPMVVVQSEFDLQAFFSAHNTRPGPPGSLEELDHYKVHEINSTSHLEEPYWPFAIDNTFWGLDPSWTRQNPLDRSPVMRADLVSLVDHIRRGVPLPDSAYMQVDGLVSPYGFGIVSLDPSTGNGFGGIELPQAAAPLGLYRGLDCHNVYSADFDLDDPYHYAPRPEGGGDLVTGRAQYVLESDPKSPAGSTCAQGGLEGLFTPYETVDRALGTTYCTDLYPTRQAYTDRVTAAADRLVAQRLLLPEERDDIIEEAEAAADEFPGCVPGRTLSAGPGAAP